MCIYVYINSAAASVGRADAALYCGFISTESTLMTSNGHLPSSPSLSCFILYFTFLFLYLSFVQLLFGAHTHTRARVHTEYTFVYIGHVHLYIYTLFIYRTYTHMVQYIYIPSIYTCIDFLSPPPFFNERLMQCRPLRTSPFLLTVFICIYSPIVAFASYSSI